jgi:quercetin dioxygenase-like cupin family protein
MAQIEFQHDLPAVTLHEPRWGIGDPLFPNGLSWREINAILTSNEFKYTYIVESDANKNFVRDYLVGSLHEGLSVLEKHQELTQAIERGWTVKAEGVEYWNQHLYIRSSNLAQGYRTTLHLYVGQAGGTSFPMHTDPDPVIVVCVQGRKTFKLEGYEPITLEVGDWLYMPANHPHQAFSETKSAIISIGFHPWNSETQSFYLPNLI